MNFAVEAVSPAQFATWVGQAKGGGAVLDGTVYLDLAKAADTMKPMTFGRVQPGLFAAAVREAGAPVHEIATDGREQ